MNTFQQTGIPDTNLAHIITSVGAPPGTLPQSWEAAIGRWQTWLRVGGKSENTVRQRRENVAALARRSRTEHPCDLTLNQIIQLFSERRWSNEYRRSMRTCLINFYDFCVFDDIVTENPASALPRIPSPIPQPRPAPDDVWTQLLDAASPRERLMALLACEAGLRRGEVAAVHVNDLIRDARGRWSLIVHGKGNKQRVVPLTTRLVGEIRSYTDRGFLFPGQVDGHLSPKHVGSVISELMPEGWSMHKLRHRFATRGYAGTRNLRAVQEALGHASVATTQRYTAVCMDEVRSVAEAAGEIFPGLQPGNELI